MQGSFPAKYFVQNTSRDSSCLDNNYQAFLLVDDGSVGRRGGETGFRAKLEDYISHQRTGIWGEQCAASVGSPIRTDQLLSCLYVKTYVVHDNAPLRGNRAALKNIYR